MIGSVVPGSIIHLANVDEGGIDDTGSTNVPLVPPIRIDDWGVGWWHLGDFVSVKVVDGAVYKSVHSRRRVER